MIIDLVKKRKKRKIELECIFEGKLEFNIITLRDETDHNYASEVEFLIVLFKPSLGRWLAPGREKGWVRGGTVVLCCFPMWSHNINFCPLFTFCQSPSLRLSTWIHRGTALAWLLLRHRGLCSLGCRTERWLTYILLDSISFSADVITWAEMNLLQPKPQFYQIKFPRWCVHLPGCLA